MQMIVEAYRVDDEKRTASVTERRTHSLKDTQTPSFPALDAELLLEVASPHFGPLSLTKLLRWCG